jgi:hypothetical protein
MAIITKVVPIQKWAIFGAVPAPGATPDRPSAWFGGDLSKPANQTKAIYPKKGALGQAALA